MKTELEKLEEMKIIRIYETGVILTGRFLAEIKIACISNDGLNNGSLKVSAGTSLSKIIGLYATIYVPEHAYGIPFEMHYKDEKHTVVRCSLDTMVIDGRAYEL